MSDQDIEQLLRLRGIETSYTDAWGNHTEVVPQSKTKLLRAMGYPVDDEAALAQALQAEIEDHWLSWLPNVLVVRESLKMELEIRVRIDQATQVFDWHLTTEHGEVLRGELSPINGELIAVHSLNDIEYQAYRVPFADQLPLGYHTLTVSLQGSEDSEECRYIVAPQQAYKPPYIKAGGKVWGPSVQLYCLRSERNWGVGDFCDLKYLIQQVAAKGGDFVGLNPIHALYPANPESASPYSPSSRRWLNVIYIDVEGIPEYAASEAQMLVRSDEFQTRLQQLRASEWIDYTTVMQTKLQALRLVFQAFQNSVSKQSPRAKAFNEFVQTGGESLAAQAAYDAIQAHYYQKGQNAWGWPAWPQQFQEYHQPEVASWVKAHQSDVDFYVWLQWIAEQQLDEAHSLAVESGMRLGLYRDLAVGVSQGSVETWCNGELYCQDASVGAPPDVLGPLGQNWGLPPMDLNKLEAQGYQPMIELFRSNMRSCGAMRIDHVMALLRLWWIPIGEDAGKGAYVHYPIDDLLGILNLESQRNQCLVIGEDLGTIPEGIFEVLQANGIHSYRVLFFETAADGGYISPAHYPEQAMAVLTTHDMATLSGFWHCDDLKLGQELGLYPDDQVLHNLYAGRHASKQLLLDSLHGHGSIPDYISRDVNAVGMDRGLSFGMQVHMAHGNSALLALQLEDWLEMDKPINVPGTSSEYPNWRRKLTRNLSELFAEPDIQQLLEALTDARRSVSN